MVTGESLPVEKSLVMQSYRLHYQQHNHSFKAESRWCDLKLDFVKMAQSSRAPIFKIWRIRFQVSFVPVVTILAIATFV